MRVQVINAFRRSGIGKESKQPYDLCRLTVVMPGQSYSRENSNLDMFGLRAVELEADPQVMERLRAINPNFPCWLEVETEDRLSGRGIASVVVNVKPASKAEAA